MSSKINFAANFCVVLGDFLKKGKWLGVVVLVLVSLGVRGQTQVIVSATEFTPNLSVSDINGHFEVGNAVLTGAAAGKIVAGMPWLGSAALTTFRSKPQHAVIANPSFLNTVSTQWYIDQSDYMFLVPGNTSITSDQIILNYTVTDLVPLSDVSVTYTIYNIINPTGTLSTCNQPMSHKSGININPVGTEPPSSQIKPGGGNGGAANPQVITVPGKADGNGIAVFTISEVYGNACGDLGIANIIIKGAPKPRISARGGTELCAGENIILEPQYPYDGDYEWYQGTTLVGTNKSLSVSSNLNPSDYNFSLRIRLNNTGLPSKPQITSDVITIKTIACCINSGIASSRQTIFYDDFGTLNLAADPTGKTYKKWDYSNPTNPILKDTTSNDAYRWAISPAPLEARYRNEPVTAGPNFDDNSYTVAAYISSSTNLGSKMGWASNIGGFSSTAPVSYDHSGLIDGAALFLNTPLNSSNKAVYTRTFNNLCASSGSEVYFECWINQFTPHSSNNPPIIGLKLTSGLNVITVPGVVTATNGTWVKVSGSIVLSGSSMTMEIINSAPNIAGSTDLNPGSQYNLFGNDLVMDDIKIMTCAPPAIDLVFNKPNLTDDTIVCKNRSIVALPTANFINYYNNSANYIYQWSQTPNDPSSWKNIIGPVTASSALIPSVADLQDPKIPDKSSVFFRVVSGNILDLIPAPTGGYNLLNPCRKYSVSLPIRGIVECPACNKPTSVTASSTPAQAAGTPKTVTICETGTARLNGAYTPGVIVSSPENKYSYVWYKQGETPGAYTDISVAPGAITQKALAPADSGIWVLRVEDYAAPTGPARPSCYTEDVIELKVLKAITNNVIQDAQTVCQGQDALPLIQKAGTTIQGNLATPTTYAWQTATTAVGPFTDIAPAANGASYNPTAVNQDTYFRRVAYAQGSLCPNVNSDPILISVTPPITTNTIGQPTQTICSGTSPVVTGAAIAGATYQWETSRTAAGTYTAIADATTQDLPANPLINTVSGTTELYYFRRVAKVGNCPHTSTPVEVSVNGGMDGGRIATNQTICLGTTPAALTSVSLASGGTAPPIRYIWETSSNGTTWTPEGAEATTNTTYTFAAAPTANITLRRVAIGGTGGCDKVTSNLITINVITPATASILTPVAVTSPGTGQHTFNAATLPITATPAASGYDGNWALATRGTLGSATNNATNTVTGMVFDDVSTLTWTVRDTAEVCPAAVATLTITRRNLTVADAKDDSLCITSLPRTVVGNGLITGETSSWSFVSAVPNVTPTWAPDPADAKRIIISAVAIPANAGKVELTFRYTVNSPLSTSGPSTKDVKITIYELAEAARVTLPSVNTCDPTITLDGNSPQQPTASGFWTKPAAQQGTLTNPRLNNTTLTGLTQLATTTLTWTITNHLCPATTANKVVNATPPVYVQADLTGREVVCLPKDAFTYTGTTSNGGPVATYRFEVVHADNTLGLVQPNSPVSTFTPGPGQLRNGDKIRLTVTADPNNGICFANGGIAKDSLIIDGYILQDTTVTNTNLDKMDTICTGKTIKLCVPQSRGNTAYQWIKDGNEIPSAVSTCIELNKSIESGDYSVRVTNSVCGIRSSDPRNIKIYDQPSVSFNPKEIKLDLGLNNGNNNTAVLQPQVTGLVVDQLVTAEWTPDSLLTQPTSFNLAPTFTAPKSGGVYRYKIDVATGSGRVFCKADASIIIKALPRVRIPNAFSPNGDNLNDTWQIDGIDAYPMATVNVYNRWGTLVWQGTPYGRFAEWDGTVKGGSILPVATYYYVIDLNEKLEEQEETFNGPITIVR